MSYRISALETGRWRFRWMALPLIASCLAALSTAPCRALPAFARRYGVSCGACHSVPPRLNAFGKAFQANFLTWPGPASPPAPHPSGLIPFSAMATASSIHDFSNDLNSTDFRMLELFAAGGYRVTPGRTAGYFLQTVAVSRGGGEGAIERGFVSAAIAGSHTGVTIGQFSPLSYQYDSINSLTQSLPAGVAEGAGFFSFVNPLPGVRLEWYDHRGRPSPDGAYAAVGVPFSGNLSFVQDPQLRGGQGVYGHLFRRRGPDSLGVLAYGHGSAYLAGLLATRDVNRRLSVLGAFDFGHDDSGDHRGASLEADDSFSPWCAVTARLEAVDSGKSQFYPVAAVTYYPARQYFVRLRAETIQAPGARSLSLFLIVQV